jgi:hypothetical protein
MAEKMADQLADRSAVQSVASKAEDLYWQNLMVTYRGMWGFILNWT